MDDKGLDGLNAEAIATGLGYGNIKTNTFSARLSAARQFGLLTLQDDGYTMTPIARGLIHPLGPQEVARLRRQALASPSLYADLISRLEGRKLPEAAALANLLYHQFQITSTAKQAAAESFLDSARFAGVLGADGILHAESSMPVEAPPVAEPVQPEQARASRPASAPSADVGPTVRIDLRLWGPDTGKVVRVRAPESMTEESFERLMQSLRLHVRIGGPED
jgi:hypothetical protein